MPDANVTVYGAPWCPDCKRSKQFLGEQGVPYDWVDIDQAFTRDASVLAGSTILAVVLWSLRFTGLLGMRPF